MNLIKARKVFNDYVSNYNINDSKIKLKIIHINRVANNSRKIAQMLKLPKEQQDLAELIGLLHDIGRFEQLRIYGTFSDKDSISHAEKGIEVLFKNNLIREFIDESNYDSIILKAIRNHSTLKIEDNLSKEELLHTKIIRDADKLDIYKVFSEERIEDGVLIGTDDISKEILSPKFFEDFKKEKLLLYSDIKTDMDFMVACLAYIYDFNFKESLQIVKEENYINKIIKRINAKDKYTREKLDEISIIAMDYINKKIKAN